MDFNIVTFHRENNYGAVLQAFALQEFIKGSGYTAGVYEHAPSKKKYAGFKGKILKFTQKTNKEANKIKRQRYLDFVQEKLNTNNNVDSKVFVAGSDQIWNAFGCMDPIYFLQFLGNDAIKISYAASMGVDKVPEERKELFKKYINDFDLISVREQGAKECIEQISSKKVQVHCDPTLLMDKEFWTQHMSEVKGLPEKYILVYLMHVPKNVNKLLRWLKKQTKCEIVLVDGQGVIQGIGSRLIKNDIALHDIGPKEFLWLIANAENVVTSSFHGTAFSIIFKKEFYSIINDKAPSRIKNLLDNLGLKHVSENENKFSRNQGIDWIKVDEVLENERKNSSSYFNLAYNLVKTKNKANNIIENLAFCTGCFACETTCPVNAIKMVLNKKGFYEPELDEDKCISCGKCMQVCPQDKRTQNARKKSWYGWNKDEKVLYESTSGGIFNALAKKVQDEGGVVFGAVYTDDFRSVVFDSSENVSIAEMQKSKYTVSNPKGVYKRIEEKLKENKKVLFCGTPCQVAGLTRYIGKDFNNLITVDFVCGGMASLGFWREHIDKLEKKYKSKIKHVDFRSKKKGWGKCYLAIEFESGKNIFVREYQDIYYKLFMEHISVREVCLSCAFHDAHCADISIADFWGYKAAQIEKHPKGISLIISNTDKGCKIVENTKDLELFELEDKYSDYAISPNKPSIAELKKLQSFLDEASEKGFEVVANNQYSVGKMSHALKWIKTKLKI